MSFSNEKLLIGGDQVNGSSSISRRMDESESIAEQRPNFLVGDDENQDTNNNSLNNGQAAGDLASEDRDGFNQNFTTPASRPSASDLAEKRRRLR